MRWPAHWQVVLAGHLKALLSGRPNSQTRLTAISPSGWAAVPQAVLACTLMALHAHKQTDGPALWKKYSQASPMATFRIRSQST